MRANLRQKMTGSTGPAGAWLWLVMALLCTAAVIASCTNQKDTKGPTFPASQTGDNPTALSTFLFPSPGPGGDQVTLTLVVQSPGGQPVVGRAVFMTTTAGRLNRTSGVTDGSGQFVAILNCDGVSSADVTALVEGIAVVAKGVCGAAATTAATGSTGP